MRKKPIWKWPEHKDKSIKELFFAGKEELILERYVRYKKRYYSVVLREDLQILINAFYTLTAKEKSKFYDKIEEIVKVYKLE